jgi:hypothetical protein
MSPPLVPFRDAAFDTCSFALTVFDCLCALERALSLGHFDPQAFDLAEYERLDQLQHGDMNWIIPGKFLAFSGPLARCVGCVWEGASRGWTLSRHDRTWHAVAGAGRSPPMSLPCCLRSMHIR